MRDSFRQDVVLGGRFRTTSPLNQGSFGMVFTARDLLTRNTVAVKCLSKAVFDADDDACPAAMAVDEHSEELAVHSRIGFHPNIVNLISSFETSRHSYLALEYCPNGDLYEAIRAGKGPLETEHVRDFMLQLVSAVEYMHGKGIYHRDIKPENIFLSQNGSMKLGDFGLATFENWSTEYGVGSDRYMAPEQFEASAGNGYSPAAADIWAIGVCLLNVLFGRNPFATPTQSDPLFSDYVRDRQSLFDVFPNMSEDTFNVLMHCMTLDPTRRSLAAVREALEAVISFTTDDESLDDFCTGGDDAHAATINREPLRTPSVTSPQVDNGTSFPWAKALQATPQKATRQLSVIQDEEMFPAPSKPMYSIEPDAASLASALDSGIGMSYKSTNVQTDPLDVPVSSSLPITSSKAIASIYGRDKEFFSKSWSDLWEEEEEELRRSSFESDNDIERVSTAKPNDSEVERSSTPAIDIVPSSRGSSTPRMSLAEMKSANSRSNSPTDLRHRISSQVRQMALSAPQKYSPPKRTGSSLMDKWAVLGNMRRGSRMEAPSTPDKKKNSADKYNIPPFMGSTNEKRKTRERSASWRKSSSGNLPFANGLWNTSKDWRSPQQTHYIAMPSGTSHGIAPLTSPSALRRKSPRRSQAVHNDDVGDLEWVGGWHDLQL